MRLASPADRRCRIDSAQQRFLPSLPASKASLRETGELRIVALGSSATQGAGASADDRSYPAVLQDELRRRLPGRVVTVINRGVGGQSSYDMLLRMQADVIDEKPSLVIWQAVVNDIVRDVGEEKLARILRKGISKMEQAGIDVVMMDLPWLQRADRYPRYEAYRRELATVANEKNVALFPRHAMMRSWARSQKFTPEEILGMDGLQMVDAAYRCLAIRMADGIAAALTGARLETPDGGN